MHKNHTKTFAITSTRARSYAGLRQEWVATTYGAMPSPTQNNAPASRKKINRRQRATTAAATVALVNAIMLTGVSHAQNPGSGATPSNTSTTSANKLPDVIVREQKQSGGDYKADEVVSPKYTVPLREIPQTIQVIPKAAIEERGASTLREVLRNVPGVSMQAGEGGVPNGDNLSIRGFNARTDMFVDGVRDFGGYTRDPFNLEQVEVSKGPASSYSGRGSTGGSINLVSKTPSLRPSYTGSVGFGTSDYKRITADINQPIGEFLGGSALRLNAMWHDADVPGRDAVENSRWGFAPSVAFGLKTDTHVTLSYFHLEQDNIPDYGIPWVPPPPSNTPLAATFGDRPAPVSFNNFYGLLARDYERLETDIITGQVDHRFSDALSLRNTLRYGGTTRDSVVTAPRFVADGTTNINRQLQSRDQHDTMFSNQTDLNLKFNTGKIGHAVVTGVEYTAENSTNRLRAGPAAPVANLLNPNPNDPFAGAITRTGARNRAETESFAVFAFDTVALHEKWDLLGGIRWDHFKTDYLMTPVAPAAPVLLSNADEMFSWRTALTFKPLPNGSIYAGYGTSFNPSAEGLTLTAALALLDPETSRTYEVGTKWDFFKRRLALTLAFFRTEKTNARTPGINPGDPPTVLQGEQHVDGIEFGFAGSITDKWKVLGGYTRLSSEVDSSNTPAEVGKELANTPEHSFSLWTTYQLPLNIEVGGGAQFVDDRYSANTNLRVAPSYWLFDAMVGYAMNKNLTLRLNLNNITNERYINQVGGGHFVPGDGRSATMTATVKF